MDVHTQKMNVYKADESNIMFVLIRGTKGRFWVATINLNASRKKELGRMLSEEF